MQEAIANEDYERAARCRDEIIALEAASLLTTEEPEDRILDLSTPTSVVSECLRMLKAGKVTDRCFACDQLAEVAVGQKPLSALADALWDSNIDVRKRAERAFWIVSQRYGMDEVDAKLQEGMHAMQDGRLEDALKLFDQCVRLAPDFSEGYNKRATCHYLLKNFPASLSDCEKTVKLNPKHFGALSGMGLCHIGMRDYESALEAFTRAVAVNPNMYQVKQYIAAVRVKLQKQREQ